MRTENKNFDGLKVRRLYFKEGFIDITHSRANMMPVGEVDRQMKTDRVITYAKIGKDGKWIDISLLSLSPIKCFDFAEIFTAHEVWNKIYN